MKCELNIFYFYSILAFLFKINLIFSPLANLYF